MALPVERPRAVPVRVDRRQLYRPVVRLKKPGRERELIIHQDDLTERATQWIETMRKGETFVRKTT
ncbi:hypothetical protein [Streptomyces avermitilis]|uniref:hypothetical protein n=1 Tax=Streptomyces avermitilis TaxID=33903 RepID=UPI0033B23A68